MAQWSVRRTCTLAVPGASPALWICFSYVPSSTPRLKVMLHGTISNDDFQHSAAMLKQCCNHSKQCRNNVATLCCAKNRRCESSRVPTTHLIFFCLFVCFVGGWI